MEFFKLKISDQIYFYLDYWYSAGGILKPGTVIFNFLKFFKNIKKFSSLLSCSWIRNPDPDPRT